MPYIRTLPDRTLGIFRINKAMWGIPSHVIKFGSWNIKKKSNLKIFKLFIKSFDQNENEIMSFSGI